MILGAWWAGKVLSAQPDLARDGVDEAALRAACALPGYTWEYLRFVHEDEVWRPAAGIFPGWPAHAADITLLDPCCGSGHFLTEALAAITGLRAAEESLTPTQAVTVALRDNVHGLEIDGRCVQIAAFALALTAWRIGGAETTLPAPHVAWVGAPPPLPKPEFAALANGDADLRRGLEALHDLFAQAPLLGSLIEVTGGDLVNPARIARIEESIAALVERMRDAEPERAEGALAARGMADAAGILARRWVLQLTNVPFRASGTLIDDLKDHIGRYFDLGRRNLATALVVRMMRLTANAGTVACVTPKEWLSAKSFQPLRDWCIAQSAISWIAGLGPGAFQTISGEVVNVALLAITPKPTQLRVGFSLIDVMNQDGPNKKAQALTKEQISSLTYRAITLRKGSELVDVDADVRLLSEYASHHQGLATGDLNRFSACWWEVSIGDTRWDYWQGSAEKSMLFGGCEHALLWSHGQGPLHKFNEENKAVRKNTHLRGANIIGRKGIIVTQMGKLPASLYSGHRFDDSTTAILPFDDQLLPAIWCFIASDEYGNSVRKIDSSIKVPAATLTKVPFDVAHWQEIASARYQGGLPLPQSDDPTQWLFHGHPRHAECPSGNILSLWNHL